MPGIDACLLEAMKLPGARGAAVVDWTSGLALGTVGESPVGDHEASAVETAELARMAAEQPSFAGRRFATTGEPAQDAGMRDVSGQDASGQDASAQDASAQDVSAQDVSARSIATEDVIVSTGDSYHLLHFVRTGIDSSVFLHLWLGREEGNLALARLRLRDLAERLVCE